MSYILEALKKSEQQRQQQQDQQVSPSESAEGVAVVSAAVVQPSSISFHAAPASTLATPNSNYWMGLTRTNRILLVALLIITVGIVVAVISNKKAVTTALPELPVISASPRLVIEDGVGQPVATPVTDKDVNRQLASRPSASRLSGNSATESNDLTGDSTINSTVKSSAPTVNAQAQQEIASSTDSLSQQQLMEIVGQAAVILPSSKTELDEQQRRKVIEQAVSGDVDLKQFPNATSSNNAQLQRTSPDDSTNRGSNELNASANESLSAAKMIEPAPAPKLVTTEQLAEQAAKAFKEQASVGANNNSEQLQAPSKAELEASAKPSSNDNSGNPAAVNRGQPPLSVLQKIPNIAVSGHVYSSLADRRSVTFNNREYSEGDRLGSNITIAEITRSGFNLAVDGYLVPIRRGRGWQAISAD